MLLIGNIDNAYLKRTLHPLYANTQATPKGVYLDPAWDHSVDIYPGFALVKQAGQQVTLPSAATNVVYGLGAFYEAPILGISEISKQGGINAAAAWVMGADAEFQIDAPAFDNSLTWTDPGAGGTYTLISAYYTGANRGKLCPAGTANSCTVPFARLLSVNSATSITIGGLDPASSTN